MRAGLMMMSALLCSNAALADDALAWRNTQPGLGIGLSMGGPYKQGLPMATLRGWSSAALSVDLGASYGSDDTSFTASYGDSEVSSRGAVVRIAPRVRVWSDQATDILVVPSMMTSFGSREQLGERTSDTQVLASAGIAMDRWFAPGVCVSGRLDLAQFAIYNRRQGDVYESGRQTRLGLEPSIAVHVFPRRKRARGADTSG